MLSKIRQATASVLGAILRPMAGPVVEQIAKPILRRVGTVVAAYLVAKEVPQDVIDQIVTGLIALGLVGVDLAFSYLNRQKVA